MKSLYLQRKIDAYLESWRSRQDRLPLIIRGARQVGKTEAILHFAESAYQHLVYINFVEEPKYRSIAAEGYRPEDIIRNITLIDPAKRFVPGETLIVFDEVQVYPDIATALKFFAQDAAYDVICSGSLLGLNYREIESNSVGYKEDYTLTPLDFEEFLWARGYAETIAAELLEYMVQRRPFPEALFQTMLGHFRDYCVLGGMPAVVRNFVESGNFSGTLQMQRQLLRDFQEDIRKYAEGVDQTRILNIFQHIPAQLAKENKKFQISKVEKNARFREYRGCVEWLQESGLVNTCYCLNFPELPLKGNYDSSKYKLYLFDIGILVAMLDDESQEDLRANKNLGVYKGALYENVVAQALSQDGYGLYYYKRGDSYLEQDFFVRDRNSLIPLEVKASRGSSKSLRTLIDSRKYADIRYGIKLSAQNIGEAEGIITFPYFCTFLLRRFLAESEPPPAPARVS